jgi:hypothetical protein
LVVRYFAYFHSEEIRRDGAGSFRGYAEPERPRRLSVESQAGFYDGFGVVRSRVWGAGSFEKKHPLQNFPHRVV